MGVRTARMLGNKPPISAIRLTHTNHSSNILLAHITFL